MGKWGLLLVAAGLAGCASAPPSAAGGRIPEVLAGIPAPILVARAVADLDSEEPGRAAAARRILQALPAEALEGWRSRVAMEPEGSPGRLDYLAVLADRGEPLEAASAGEAVAASLREIERDGPEGRGTILAIETLRSLGPAAAEPLQVEAARGGPRGALARRLLGVLGLPDRELRGAVP